MLLRWALLGAIINHLPFPVNQPVTVGGKVYFDHATQAAVLLVEPGGDGLQLRWRSEDLGRLTWSLTLDALTSGRRPRPAASFETLALKFKRTANTELYDDYQAQAERAGMGVEVAARVFPSGFLDIRTTLGNVSAKQVDGMYAAVVARWEHPPLAGHRLCYDDRIEDFDANGLSRFSAGDGRHWSLQHGIDWLSLDFGRAAALLVSGYSESPTALDDTHSARNKSPRFIGLNIPQFKNEAQMAAGAMYLVTEFARDNRPYRDRFLESRLPAAGQTLANDSRVIFSDSAPTREQADEAFLGYNAWAKRAGDDVEIGVPGTVFGTSYFPYSTFGENFGTLKLPGQETDAFWPLSADTVTHWRDFADDIRRDLRIAKAMGFTVIRLHFVDVIAHLPEPVQYEYLDFLFGELRQLKLRAMFSTNFTYWPPKQIAARVARYSDVIDRLELENEVLIWGIPLDRPQYWSRIYHEVKKAAPNVQIHWTSHLNTGIFTRLDDLRVPYDVVSAHAYIDSLDAIPSGRGFALAVGNYARRAGKPAIYTEWNWRGLTRMTPDARAQVYPAIMENLLATRSIQELYQFHLQETMCVNPHTRKGIRHYEALWLSRRPKPEAFELMKLMDRYALPDTPNRQLAMDHVVMEDGQMRAEFHLRNVTSHGMKLKALLEKPPSLEARIAGKTEFEIAAGGTASIPVEILVAPDAPPGFYHLFVRLEGSDGLVRYGWAEVRHAGQPRGAGIDLNRRLAVVYAENAPVIEMEAAYLLAQTMESASGRPVGLYSAQDLPADAPAVIAIGNPKLSKAPVLALKDYDATVEFVLSYWKYAKDSAVRRVGLVEKKVPAGADVANLP